MISRLSADETLDIKRDNKQTEHFVSGLEIHLPKCRRKVTTTANNLKPQMMSLVDESLAQDWSKLPVGTVVKQSVVVVTTVTLPGGQPATRETTVCRDFVVQKDSKSHSATPTANETKKLRLLSPSAVSVCVCVRVRVFD